MKIKYGNMKDLKDFILESGEFEMVARDYKWKINSAFFYFNPVGEVYGFATEQDIKDMVTDEILIDSDAEIILNLGVGEIYSPDGGGNQYVRIKK